ncbi:MAG TPA: hypothetical protein VEH62_07875 [Gemmatimonadales bacterium]|nr:hypothetical protein [Gemmatimonadales bacterium]
MRALALATTIALAAGGCRWLTEPRGLDVSSPADVTLRVGQSVRVDGRLRVTFLSVPADSRCPADAICVWAGDALVAITTSLDGGAALADTVHTMPAASSDTTGIYIVSLTGLTPYPRTTAPVAPGDYVAQLHVVAFGFVTTTGVAPPTR